MKKNFFVDENCIACDACTMEAPEFFAMNEEEGLAFILKQPENDKQMLSCETALESCPVEAISSRTI
jgi:ferredoxin